MTQRAGMLVGGYGVLGRVLDRACSSDLTTELDALIVATEACVPELATIRDTANSVRSSSDGP